jgi:hypothetical protein
MLKTDDNVEGVPKEILTVWLKNFRRPPAFLAAFERLSMALV